MFPPALRLVCYSYAASILFSHIRAQTYSATYLPSNAPDHSEEGQSGTNQCGTGINQTSNCQNAYLNSVTDWCIWSPPEPGADSVIGNTERIEVAWCIKNGTGARLIPDGTITGAHFVQTPDFVQITGSGNLTFLNVPVGDEGGELDPHGQDGLGNPIGGLVFSSAFGPLQEIFEWTNFISDTQFCFRACKPGPMAPTWCQHIYDTMGCAWNMPANYDPGVFENCKGDSGEPMGVYGASTFFQGQPVTPPAHPVPSSSSCASLSTIGNGLFAVTSSAPATPTGSAPSVGASPPLSPSLSSGLSPSSQTGPVTASLSPSPVVSMQGATTTGRSLASSAGASPTATNAGHSNSHVDRLIFPIGSGVMLMVALILF